MGAKDQRTAQAILPDVAVLAVGARFVLYFVLFAGVTTLVAIRGGMDSLCVGTARISTALIALTGQRATLSGTLIRLTNRDLSIDLECTAILVAVLFCALVLAYPVKPRLRLFGLVLGVPAILLANLVRIVAVARVSVGAPAAFDFVHDYLFQAGMVLFVAALWVVWLSFSRRYAR